MGAADKFKSRNGSSAVDEYKPRNAGVSTNSRDPGPTHGDYVLVLLEQSDSSYPKPAPGKEGFFKSTFGVLAVRPLPEGIAARVFTDFFQGSGTHPDFAAGDQVFIGQQVTGKAEEAGKSKVKEQLIGLLGFNNESEMHEGFPDWAVMWDACSGDGRAAQYLAKKDLPVNLIGTKVAIRVSPNPKKPEWPFVDWIPFTQDLAEITGVSYEDDAEEAAE